MTGINTKPDLPAQMSIATNPATQKSRLSGASRTPVITAIVGALTFGAGFVIGRVPYRVPGGFMESAYTVDRMCGFAHQLGANTITPMCVHAHDLMVLCGCLILAGLVTAATGITVAVRRMRCRAATAEEFARAIDSA